MAFRNILPCLPPGPVQPSEDRAPTGPGQEASGEAGSSKSHLDETQALNILPTSVYGRLRHESANTALIPAPHTKMQTGRLPSRPRRPLPSGGSTSRSPDMLGRQLCRSVKFPRLFASADETVRRAGTR